MKTNLCMLVSIAVIAAAAACGPPQRRSDWRTPAPGGGTATPCTTDADCNGGVCAVDPAVSAGQTPQGTCSQAPIPSLPSGPGRPDGGAPAPHPPSPLVQPSSSDIQI